VSGDLSLAAFLKLVSGRRGHFRLESGHHSDLWLDLDPLFVDARAVDPFVTALSDALRPYNASVICGPLLGGAFLAQLVARALGAPSAYRPSRARDCSGRHTGFPARSRCGWPGSGSPWSMT
jgi:orotate phosphoribosyltransferase